MKKLLIALLVFAGFAASAQTYTGVAGRWEYQWVKVDSGYRGPLDTLASAPIGATAVKGSTLYIKLSTGYWQAITGAGGSGVWGFISGTLSAQGDLMAKFGTKYDTATRLMDTLYAITDSTFGFYINGIFHSFKARGSVLSFMGRNGAITLTQHDVDSALGYVPSQLPNVANSLQVINNGNTNGWQTGLYSARPAPGNFGNYYTATDSLAIYFDNGITWLSISKSAVSVPSVFGRTGPVVAQTGDYTAAQVGLANVLNSLQIVNTLGTPSASSDVFANRPAAGTAGRLFVSTDTKEIYRDNGSSWDKIGSGASGGVTTYAALTDVNLTSLINGQLAQYNSGTGKWVNITPTNALVGLGNVPNVDATNAANISSGTLPAARIGAGSIDLTTKVTGALPDANIASAANWNAKVSDSGFQVLQATLTGVPVDKYVDGSGHRFVRYDTTGTHPGAMGTNAGIQKKIDSLSAVIGNLLSAKFGLTDTGYTKTLASVYTLRKVSDSLAAAYTAGLGTKFSAADTGYTHTLASVFTLAKVRDSLAALIAGSGGGITQLTGDVTAGPGSGSKVATIANNAVTNAKAAQMGPNTIKGNNTGSTANAADLSTANVIAMLNAITNFSGVSFLGYGSYASRPTTGTGIYFASDSAKTGGWFYINGATDTNINPSTSIAVRALGQPGDTTLFSVTGSILAGYIFHVAAVRDSAGGCLHHTVNPDGSWTFYSTCVTNAGNVSSLQKGTYASRPAAAGNAGACWLATDSAQIACSDGTSWAVFARANSSLSGTGYAKFAGSTPSYLTPTQVTADLNLFTSTLQGLVPPPVTVTGKLLSDNGTWVSGASGIGQIFAKGLNTALGTDTVATYTINIMDYGAVPDCNGTSGNGTDNTAAVRSAIAAANAVGASIFIPPVPKGSPSSWKGFRITDSLLMKGKNIELYGAGMPQFIYYQLSDTPSIPPSVLYFDSPTADALVIDSTSANKYPVVRLHDFGVQNIYSTRATAGAGLVIRSNNQQSQVYNVSISRFYTDVNQISANLITYQHDNLLFPVQYGAIVGNNLSNDFGGHFFEHVNVVADTFATTTAIGIYVKNPAAFEMSHCSISGLVAKPNGQFIVGVYADYSNGPTSDLRITNCWFEGLQQNTIKIRNFSGGNAGNILIADDELAMYNASSTSYPSIDISNVYNLQLHGLVFLGQSGDPFAMRLDSISNLSTSGPMNVAGYTQLANITNSTINQNDFYGTTLHHAAVTDSFTHHTIGASTLDGLVTANGGITIDPGVYTLTGGYQMRLSGQAFQGAAFNNQIWADNANYVSGWTRLATGYTNGVNMYNGQFGVFANNTGSGSFTPTFPLKVDFSNGGAVDLGGSVAMSASGTSTGASMTVDATKITFNPSVIPTGSSGTDSFLVYHAADGTVRTIAPTGGGIAGSDTWIQYNNAGNFGASTNFRFNQNLNQLAIDSNKYTLTGYQMRLSDIYSQMAAANNFAFFDNAYYNGGWTRVNSGYVEGFNLLNGQVCLIDNHTAASGSFTPVCTFKTDDSGAVAIGGNINQAHGAYNGNNMLITNNSLVLNDAILPNGTTTDSVLVETTSSGLATVKKVAQSSIGGTSGNIWSQTTSGTVLTNSTAQTSILGTGTGSLTIPANTLTVGKVVTMHGFVTVSNTSGTGGIVLTPMIGSGSQNLSIGAQSLAATGCEITATYTILTTGTSATAYATLKVNWGGITTVSTFGTITIGNTASTIALDLQAAWGTASSSNSIQSVPYFTVKIE